MIKIYLASKSPRRAELLQQIGVEFEVLFIDTPEIIKSHESPEDYSTRVTSEKLLAAWLHIQTENLPHCPVLCADTEVVLDGVILGKPRDERDGFNMLKQYSNRTHQVITSVGLIHHDYQKIQHHVTEVTFSTMTDDDIRHYLASGNYKDKAGGYGIQGTIGQFISRIDGCFYSVMGLPLNIVRLMLHDLNCHLLNA
jgi:septum formation protein